MNARVQDTTVSEDTEKQKTTHGKGATMPVLAADKYAELVLANLTEFDPEYIKLGSMERLASGAPGSRGSFTI